jgi:hypothetical protein
MRALALTFALIVNAPVCAERVDPTHHFTAFRIEVTWAESSAELERYRRQHGHKRKPGQAGRPTRLNGFSVLGKRDGELVCLIYAIMPKQVNDDLTTALGHELLHCLAGTYHN